jgi:hypothetical protein
MLLTVCFSKLTFSVFIGITFFKNGYILTKYYFSV